MSEVERLSPLFATVAMAEILLAQDLWRDAAAVVESLLEREPSNPRVIDLRRRLELRATKDEIVEIPVAAKGEDRVDLRIVDGGLQVTWELTDRGLEVAKNVVRYSGRRNVRVFTALAGPRGVRTGIRDMEIGLGTGQISLVGVPLSAVYVAAVGYLGKNGVFVPLARSQAIGGRTP